MPENGKRKVCFVTSECVPYAKTGGLADVSGSLPKALAKLDCHVKLFMPLYSSIPVFDYTLEQITDFKDIPVQIGDKTVTFNIWYGKLPDSEVEAYFIDCPHYFHRDSIYTGDPDEDERFILLQNAVLNTLQRIKWAPDVIHCNDWQTSLIPVYLQTNYKWDKLFENTSTMLSIHNIGYQGRFSEESVARAFLSYDNYYYGGPYEYNGTFSFLKCGILYSDIITTVSPTYAKEVQTHEYGAGLEGILSSRRDDLYGILNGIDTDEWDPGKDKYIKYNYDFETIDFKRKNKMNLFRRIERGFREDVPTIGMVSRLTGQKGFELLEPVFSSLMQMDVQFVSLGSGEKKYEDFFEEANVVFPEKFMSYIGYSAELSHLITAGCDMFLMPSYYEPCGLNQMYSLRYGTIPIVRSTGGLADTVKDYSAYPESGNGFSFNDFDSGALLDAVDRAVKLYHSKDEWRKVIGRGMSEDFSWDRSAVKYTELYDVLIDRKN